MRDSDTTSVHFVNKFQPDNRTCSLRWPFAAHNDDTVLFVNSRDRTYSHKHTYTSKRETTVTSLSPLPVEN